MRDPVRFIARGLPSGGGGGGGGTIPDPGGRIHVDGKIFRHDDGSLFSWRGATMFLLFRRYLLGEDIGRQITWLQQQDINVARVLGMVAWSGQAFGPSTPGYWDQLPWFVETLLQARLRLEFTVFADAQIVLPDPSDQRRHLQRVIDLLDPFPNVVSEICNEPFKNGVDPREIFSPADPHGVPMAYGDYILEDDGDGLYMPGGPLDYVTVHTPRDSEAWSRKAKDIYEFQEATDVPAISDEPMGAAEVTILGRRDANPDAHFWHHAVATLLGGGGTFHSDAGLQGDIPAPGSVQQACADAVSLAWRSIPPEFRTGTYTRSGLDNLPLEWSEDLFPEQTSRIYARLLGNRACCVAIKPNPAWRPVGRDGWRIVSTTGPQDSLVLLER